MNKKFSPLLVTTPRTGSSIICHYLGQIGRQSADYQNNLFEYFDLAPWNNLQYKVFKHFNKNIIGLETNENIVSLAPNTFDASTSLDFKFQQLKNNDFKYMIKIIPYKINLEILDYCNKNYDFIFLERKNKLNQLLSFMAMVDTKISHYRPDTTKIVKGFKFDFKLVKILDLVMQEYKQVKLNYSGPTIYYEDIFTPEFNFTKLLSALKLDIPLNHELIVPLNTVASPYKLPIEELISNKNDYLSHKQEINEYLRQW